MEALSNILLSRQFVATAVAYFIGLALYRLFLHPLAKFPGPKLAAVTRYYEGYYDLYHNGQYTFKIAELHRKYGPIVRISPYELHVSDPAFFDAVYRQDAPLDKYSWMVDAFAAKGATLFTASHDVHKARRVPLNPFFSKAKVASRGPDLIKKHLDKLYGRISKFSEAKVLFDFGAAITAFSRDVANDFIIGKSYNSLESDDFDVALLAASQGAGQFWRLTKFVRWFAPTMRSIPVDWLVKNTSGDMNIFFRYLQETEQDTRNLMKAVDKTDIDEKGPRTIVHEIMQSKLPPSEKKFVRVFEDVSTVTGAGFETVASALRLIFFNVYSNPEILRRVRAELASAGAGSRDTLELKTLEQLPYLTATLMEGLRLSPAIATRMARISPKTDIAYGSQRIPAGTPVGMTLILMHTDEASHPDPRRFNPDRWMDPEARKNAEKAFAPFSKGTRNCLGRHLAWAEMYLSFVALVQGFDFDFKGAEVEDFECESDQFAIGTKGKGALKANATPYNA